MKSREKRTKELITKIEKLVGKAVKGKDAPLHEVWKGLSDEGKEYIVPLMDLYSDIMEMAVDTAADYDKLEKELIDVNNKLDKSIKQLNYLCANMDKNK